MQKLRGRLYLQDGAIEREDLTRDGRHSQSVDEDSWHLLTLDPQGRVSGCARYRQHENPVTFRRLGIVDSALAQCDRWGRKLRNAVENEISSARKRDLNYAEVGGWALAHELRCTTEALRSALGTYALAQLLGGSLGISTVTVRNHSSSILRRIGGRSLEVEGHELPDYYDPKYKCQMEMLRFDSGAPNSKYRNWIDEIRSHLLTVPVICRHRGSSVWSGLSAAAAGMPAPAFVNGLTVSAVA
ncbi:MAG: hypothetical protein ACRD7E_25480 [Bryobacteraceae bacterium]